MSPEIKRPLTEEESEIMRGRIINDAKLLEHGVRTDPKKNEGYGLERALVRPDGSLQIPQEVVERAKRDMEAELRSLRADVKIERNGIRISIKFINGEKDNKKDISHYLLTLVQDAKHSKSGKLDKIEREISNDPVLVVKILVETTKNAENKEVEPQDLLEQADRIEDRYYMRRDITEKAEKLLGKNDSFSGEYPRSFYNFKVDVSREKVGAIKIVVKETGGKKASASFLINNDSGYEAAVDRTYTGMPFHLSEVLEYFTKE